MEKIAIEFVNKIPTYKCLKCDRKNQKSKSYDDICPHCGQRAKYVGLEISKKK